MGIYLLSGVLLYLIVSAAVKVGVKEAIRDLKEEGTL